MSETIRPAGAADIAAIRSLVDGAYRGEGARRGWTHEADLLSGQRIDEPMLEGMLGDPRQTLLVAEEEGRLVGCVCVARQEGYAYLGLLTVAPSLQGQGLGRRLAAAAEAEARAGGIDVVRMTVIHQRTELIAWYGRLGYRDTGRTEPFPADDRRFGMPLRDNLDFVVLEKRIGEAA